MPTTPVRSTTHHKLRGHLINPTVTTCSGRASNDSTAVAPVGVLKISGWELTRPIVIDKLRDVPVNVIEPKTIGL